ncbi:MAG: hydantoinase/oxoprolinase family protein [Deltaproteobacteria bacterium]|nr:hydantoinase/oxoprolinase family protein [Deltaproteobacteria bacterium]
MILGIDVGGTHTDAVLMEEGRVRKKAKVLTDADRLLTSLSSAAAMVLDGEDPQKLRRVVLSTTLSTNAIVQGKVDKVGMILASGPGLSPADFRLEGAVHFVSGYVNHRGIEVAPIDREEIGRIARSFEREGIEHAGAVGKFSTRNPKQELAVKEIMGPRLKHVSLGHRMSGNLNFPRRAATACLNASVWGTYKRFAEDVQVFIREQGITAPVYILKADGGTFNIADSADFPVQTILSGPAASIMGVMSMVSGREDAVVLDMGGTTTDIAVLAGGVPLLEPLGVVIGGYKTLIRGMLTRSVGLGGDSAVKTTDDGLVIGPRREGVAAAFGGPCPTPTDAMIILGLTDIGDRRKALNAIGAVSQKLNLSVEDTAKRIFEQMCAEIAAHVRQMIDEVNRRPVYTIHEMLEDARLAPRMLYLVGGPAKPVSQCLGGLLGCPVCVPDHAEAANAVGAALARTTSEITLLADTERKTLFIPERGMQKSIPATCSMQEVVETGRELLRQAAVGMGADPEDLEMEVVEAQEFNMIKQFYTTGKNMRVKIQVKPGLISLCRKER